MTHMTKVTMVSLAPVAAAVAIALAPAGGVGVDPQTPYGTNPSTSTVPTYHVDNQDEVDTSGGFVDRPF
ncbi:hypothetical protein [Mycolicibacterium sp. J2]|uniref:hypothetical protein n=1 Tax=Mycolicibacterium sp. J2 TaxID=2993511 RepID=UPI00224AA38B|nr:hypothetical protein [Mycolicibacterium sp. J2]MCX2711841.1 hypothetical protein [Mycolicibacterium sp. J2]